VVVDKKIGGIALTLEDTDNFLRSDNLYFGKMAGRDNPFDMQIKLLMIGDSGKYLS
jgi:hypothetical protein